MAKFSETFLQGLLQPSYQQGLFTAAERAGQLPGQLQQQKVQQALGQINTNTPEGLLQLAKFYRQQGDMVNALKYEKAARELSQQQTTLTNVESLRENIIDRATKIPGLENLANAAKAATPAQLESMRQTVLQAEQDKQLRTEQGQRAKESAEKLGFDSNFIETFSEDPEGLVEVVRSVAEAKALNTLEKQSENAANATLVKRATSYNAPQELIDDIKDGLYTGEPLKALAAMRGEDSKNESYQNSETGEVFLLPTKGAKVFKDNQWSFPSELGLIAAPKVTAEGSIPKFRAENRSTTFLGFAAGATDRFINELDTFGNLQGDVLLSGVSPLTTDATEALDSYRAFTREALLRFTSGAAVPEAEVKRYTDMVNITSKDLFSPKAMVHKIIAAAALTSINAKQTSGEISASEARILALEAGSITLTEEDYDLLRSDRPGSMKKVVKKYTDPLLKDSGDGAQGTADSILSKYNF